MNETSRGKNRRTASSARTARSTPSGRASNTPTTSSTPSSSSEQQQHPSQSEYEAGISESLALSRLLSVNDPTAAWSDFDNGSASVQGGSYRPWEAEAAAAAAAKQLVPPNVLAPLSASIPRPSAGVHGYYPQQHNPYHLMDSRLPSFQSQFHEFPAPTSGASINRLAGTQQPNYSGNQAAVAAVAAQFHALQPRKPNPKSVVDQHPALSAQLRKKMGRTGSNEDSSTSPDTPGQVAAISSTDSANLVASTSSHHAAQNAIPVRLASEKNSKKKRKRCGDCSGCSKKENCGDCAPCRNDKSHQICKVRRCERLTEKRPKRSPVMPPSSQMLPTNNKKSRKNRGSTGDNFGNGAVVAAAAAAAATAAAAAATAAAKKQSRHSKKSATRNNASNSVNLVNNIANGAINPPNTSIPGSVMAAAAVAASFSSSLISPSSSSTTQFGNTTSSSSRPPWGNSIGNWTNSHYNASAFNTAGFDPYAGQRRSHPPGTASYLEHHLATSGTFGLNGNHSISTSHHHPTGATHLGYNLTGDIKTPVYPATNHQQATAAHNLGYGRHNQAGTVPQLHHPAQYQYNQQPSSGNGQPGFLQQGQQQIPQPPMPQQLLLQLQQPQLQQLSATTITTAGSRSCNNATETRNPGQSSFQEASTNHKSQDSPDSTSQQQMPLAYLLACRAANVPSQLMKKQQEAAVKADRLAPQLNYNMKT